MDGADWTSTQALCSTMAYKSDSRSHMELNAATRRSAVLANASIYRYCPALMAKALAPELPHRAHTGAPTPD